MPETGNYFAHLGLAPGVYSEQQLADRLADIRAGDPGEQRLADATLAYCVLRDRERQRRYLARMMGSSANGPGSRLDGQGLRIDGQASRVAPASVVAPDYQPPTPGPYPSALPSEPDPEETFSAAAAAMFEGDSTVLRYSNRMRLLELASRLGIAPFEANLLIERTRYRVSTRPPAHAELDPGWPDSGDAPLLASDQPAAPMILGPGQSRRLTRWLIAIALALLADAAALIFLLPG